MAGGRVPLCLNVILFWSEFLQAFDLSQGVVSRSAPLQSSILVIAHRGSSGVLPEHTAAAYRRAIEDGADYVECDVTLTRDLVPVCIHENWLSQTTDVATRREFADRRRNLTVELEDGGQRFNVDDWFAIDFTLAELKTLRVKQRFSFRDQSHDGLHQIATLEEHLAIVRGASREVGTYPELKQPHWLNSLEIMRGRKFEDILLEELERNGYGGRDDPCIIQSFNEKSLYYLANRTTIRLAMLIESEVPASKLTEWSGRGIYAVGPWVNLITQFWTNETGYKNWINSTTDLVSECHRHGLMVHAYTFRNEDRFLPWDFGQDIYKAYDYYVDQITVDGFFTDFPETLVNFRNRPKGEQSRLKSHATQLVSGIARKPSSRFLAVLFGIALYAWLSLNGPLL